MNKIALITGGTSGIGLAMARAFAAASYHLVLIGMEKNGHEIATEISDSYKIKCLFSPTDVSDYTALEKLSELVQQKNLIPDILINNAGIQFVSPVENFPVETWNKIINVNLSAAFYISKLFWNHLKSNKWGRIINIASAHGLVASEYKSAYVAAKHGIIGLTKTLALEGAAHGITVNAICPGYVKTPLVEKQIDDQAKAHNISADRVEKEIMLVKQPVKKFVPEAAIASLALYLCSPQSDLITGASLPVEGGWTAQ